MSDDLIRRSDAIEMLQEAIKAYPPVMKGCGETRDSTLEEAINLILDIPSADRPQGYWTKTDVATYRCSKCGKIQIADDVNELNFCCCCGSRNKVWRLKGADDE